MNGKPYLEELKQIILCVGRMEDPDNVESCWYFMLNEREYKKTPARECALSEYWRGMSRMKAARKIVSAGDRIVGAVIREGASAIGIAVEDSPYEIDNSRRFVSMPWEDGAEGFCEKCRLCGADECPEDTLSPECPRNKLAWVLERVTDAVNELL
ncbi:MAG: hypothetical protein IJG36_04485 [Synergistaceae bacterium]|nr:hypothetical protein [Synergistaceae bacterium]